jgi:tetratricopeptide (TPR) repeat protein
MMTAVIVGVAVAARLAHLWAVRDTPFFDVLMGDARAYDAWGQRLAAGDWVGTDVFYQAPLYPYFLGVIYAAFGRDLVVVRVVQALVGGASAALLADAATRLFSRRAGWVAGLGLALYAPALFFDVLLQKTVLDVFFVCLLLWVSSRLMTGPSHPALWAGLGATLGALSLTRENALLLVLVAIAWAVSHRDHEATKTTKDARSPSRGVARDDQPAMSSWQSSCPSWLRGFCPLGALLLGLAVVLLPVIARNYAVTGGVYLTTSQFGPNFYIGNNPAADGTYMSLRPGRGAPEFERQDATELAERALGRALSPAEVSAYWTDRAVSFITAEPARWLSLTGRKVALLWNATEMLDTESQESYEDESPVLGLLATVGHFGVLVPLAVVGLVATWPDRRRLWPVLALGSVYAASVVLFYVFARYRFPLVPFLMLFAAVGVLSARSLFVAASSSRRAALILALVLTAVAVNWPLLSPTRMRAITETNLGTALHEAGRLDEAVVRYRKAVVLQPDYAPAYNNLGVTLRAQGNLDEAIATYERGLRVDGDSQDLHFNLANALLSQNRADEAAAHLRASLAGEPDSADTHNNLGTALAAKGQYEPAVAEFRAAIALDPGSVLAHRNLGNALASMGRTAEALAALERAVAIAPADADANYDLGSLLLEAGRHADAALRLRAAIAANPRSPRALNNLGIALASQGQLQEALALFDQALAIDPGFADARRNRETARTARER